MLIWNVFIFGVLIPAAITVVVFIGFLFWWWYKKKYRMNDNRHGNVFTKSQAAAGKGSTRQGRRQRFISRRSGQLVGQLEEPGTGSPAIAFQLSSPESKIGTVIGSPLYEETKIKQQYGGRFPPFDDSIRQNQMWRKNEEDGVGNRVSETNSKNPVDDFDDEDCCRIQLSEFGCKSKLVLPSYPVNSAIINSALACQAARRTKRLGRCSRPLQQKTRATAAPLDEGAVSYSSSIVADNDDDNGGEELAPLRTFHFQKFSTQNSFSTKIYDAEMEAIRKEGENDRSRDNKHLEDQGNYGHFIRLSKACSSVEGKTKEAGQSRACRTSSATCCSGNCPIKTMATNQQQPIYESCLPTLSTATRTMEDTLNTTWQITPHGNSLSKKKSTFTIKSYIRDVSGQNESSRRCLTEL